VKVNITHFVPLNMIELFIVVSVWP